MSLEKTIHLSPEGLEPEGAAASAADKLTMLIRQAVEEKASDIHLRAGAAPRLRIDGELFQIKGLVPDEPAMRAYFYRMLRDDQVKMFERTFELDFSHDVAGVCRVRVNLYMERSSFCAALRLVPRRIPSMEDIMLPEPCERLTRLTRGLVLVTGPTGSGKSTTLAAMIDHINATRRCHILTIEDPIEYHYEDRRALVSQRELDLDTKTFTAALRHSFRQDPDVVLLGEMRDPETMATSITLAETGHLTFSTLHTSDCTQTITRIVDAFPPHQQEQIRSQLALSLEAVISQRLLRMKGKKRADRGAGGHDLHPGDPQPHPRGEIQPDLLLDPDRRRGGDGHAGRGHREAAGRRGDRLRDGDGVGN